LIKNFAIGIDLISFRLTQLVVKPRPGGDPSSYPQSKFSFDPT